MPDLTHFDNSTEKTDTPLYQSVFAWLEGPLSAAGYHRPFRKRLALVISGLLDAASASRGDLTRAIAGLRVSTARPESIARRLARLASDPASDPQRLLPAIFTSEVLATLLEGEVRAHAANVRSGLVHHARFRPLNLIVDLTTKKDQVVILVVGLAYRGIVLPLAVRTWPHNTTLVDGTYYQHLLSALAEVNTRLPAELREHVILVGDRAFGVPRMVDAASALGWAWVLRVQGQVRVRLPNHTVHPIRSLAPERGALWRGGFGHVAVDDVNGTSPTVSIFKEAGWRSCQVIAVWDEAADEPWLLISNLPASQAQIRSYAQRWAIERLFLSWKSHGWDLEVLRMRTPETIGRMIASMALATHWCLMIGAAHAEHELHDLALRAQKRASAVYQPRLPGLSGDKPDHRPYPAKYSLFSWGRQIIADTACRSQTPAFCPTLPNWQAPNWSIECAKIFEPAA